MPVTSAVLPLDILLHARELTSPVMSRVLWQHRWPLNICSVPIWFSYRHIVKTEESSWEREWTAWRCQSEEERSWSWVSLENMEKSMALWKMQ